MEKYEQAERDYALGMKYKDIAEKYDVTINTVKSWKTRYQWIRGPGNSKHTEKSVHTKEKSVHTKKKSAAVDEFGLSEEHRLFAIYFMKTHSAVKAYQKVYKCTYENAVRHAWQVRNKEEVQRFIEYLREQQCKKIDLKEQDIIQRYAEIAFADPLDYVTDDGNLRQIDDGSAISQIIPTKTGARVVMADKMKALEKLQQYLEKMDAQNITDEEEKSTIVIAPRIRHGDMDTTAETV